MTTSKAAGHVAGRRGLRKARAGGAEAPSRRPRRKSSPARAASKPATSASKPATAAETAPTAEVDDPGRPAAGAPDVGVNLRLLREERGLTLQELAERSGVSKAMLNQIEGGKSSPTIALGWKIANGLGVPFGALLGEPMPGDFLVHPRDQVQVLYSADRRMCTRALFPPGDARAAELYELTLEPGASEDAQSHTPGTREQIYVTSGQLKVETSDHSAELGVGDVLFFCADRPHRYHNPGRSTARFVLVMIYPAARRRPA